MEFSINAIGPAQASRIMATERITNEIKQEIIQQNPELLKSVNISMTKAEYAYLMKNRPLQRFRPIRNSFTKKGDKILLAQALEIEPTEVNNYIEEIIDSEFDDIKRYSPEEIEKTQAYVYRHGTKEQALKYLENELSHVKFTLKKLYKTLDNETGGYASYFNRPCHYMDNQTLVKTHEIVTAGLTNAVNTGTITHTEGEEAAKWAIRRIYDIQNNSKLIRVAKIVYNNT